MSLTLSTLKKRVRRYFEVGTCAWLEKNENENRDERSSHIVKPLLSTLLHCYYTDAASPWTFITLVNKRRVVSESVYVVETLAMMENQLL